MPTTYPNRSTRRSKHLLYPPKFRVEKDPRRGGHYLVKFYLGGRNHTLSTLRNEKRAAEKEAATLVLQAWQDWKAALANPDVHLAPSPATPPPEVSAPPSTAPTSPLSLSSASPATVELANRPFEETVKLWLKEYGEKAPRSLKTVEGLCKGWLKRLKCEQLKDLTPQALAKLQLDLIPEVSDRTADSLLTYMKKFCKWCVEKGFLQEDPSVAINPKLKATYGGATRNKDVWDEDFFQDFLKHFEVPDRKALRLYWHTGIDLCDIARLELCHIKRYADGVNYIELLRLKAKDKSSKSKEVIRFPISKDNAGLHGLIEDAIKRARRDGRTHLFNRAGVEPEDFTRRLTNKRTEVFRIYYPEIKPLTWKALRYTFFTRCRNEGIPDPVLVKWGGWVDASMLYRHYDQGVTTAQFVRQLMKPRALHLAKGRKAA